jgi:TRAP-type transport system periplasmic protein
MLTRFERVSRRRFAAGAAACAAIPLVKAPARAAQYEFKGGGNLAVDHPLSVRVKQMWAAIEKESGGRIHGEYFPNSVLGGDVAMLTQMRAGATQFAMLSPGITSGFVPTSDICNIGFAFKDDDEGLRAMDGPLGEYVRKEFVTKGIYAGRNIWAAGMRQLTNSVRPIRTPDDMAGLKLRVVESKIVIGLFKTLGASPTPMSLGETYTALQTKILDGQEQPLAALESSRFYEVQKYLSLTNETWGSLWFLVNGDLWKSLPPDIAGIIERNNTKYANLERRDIKVLNVSVTDKLARQGMIVNKADQTPFRARLQSYYKEWATTFGPTEWGLLQNSVSGKLVDSPSVNPSRLVLRPKPPSVCLTSARA